ncbi:MAG: endo-1,4-beta-xylanase [Phycisphaerae bacterium]
MNIKKIVKHFYIFLTFTTALSLSQCYGDWRTDANNRIEQIRRGNFRITAVSQSDRGPLSGVNIKISQVKHDFGFGSCINYNISDPNYTNFFKNHFEWAVMENESKWYSNEPAEQGNVTYEAADKISDWCAANGITMRGHCIFWEKEKYTQQWLKDLAFAPLPAQSPLRTAVENRMDSAVNHFKGKFVHWDVDNEILHGSFYKDRLGEEIWYWMFNEAHRIDPGCRLFVNEYDVLWKNNYDTSRYENFITKLLNQSLPVGGIGIQGHIEPNFSRTDYITALDKLGKFNLPIWITEFDVKQVDPNLRANDLEDFYRISFSHPAVGGVMMWGFWQGSHWRENCHIVNNDWTLNEAGKRYESLLKEWTTNDSSATDDKGNAGFRGFYGKYNVTLSSASVKPLTVTIDVVPGGPNEFTFELPDDSNTNLLVNPGFENGTAGWAGRNCSIAADTNEKHSGTKSAKAFGRTDTWQGIKQSMMGKMENGKTYRISAWVKLENADSSNIQLTIAQTDSADTNYIRIASAAADNRNWVELSGDFTLKYKGQLGTLDVYFEGPAAGVNFYVDDVNVFGPPAPPAKPLDTNAVGKIDAAIRYQQFEGFGAAGGYDPNWLTSNPKKQELYTLMFEDLGLEIYRIQNLYGIDEKYIDNTVEIINANVGVSLRPVKIMIASWSPPPALKSNNHTTGGTLKKDANGKYMYEEFADWWADSVANLSARGVKIDYLSIQNECDIETGYASCKFSPTEDTDWAGYNLAFEAVYKKLYSQFGDKMPKMLAPETMGFGRSRPYIDAIIDTNHVYAWTHHLYSDGSGGYENPEGYVAALRKYAARYAGKPFFQTEYSRNPDYNDAMFTARHIQNCLVHENLTSYCYWSLFRKGAIGGGLITLATPIGSEGYKINPTYYTFKQFSAFIKSGFQRIEASTDSPALRITSFISPDNKKISTVIINTSPDTDISLTITAENCKFASAKIYRTSRTENCILIGDMDKNNVLTVPKNSITTLSSEMD